MKTRIGIIGGFLCAGKTFLTTKFATMLRNDRKSVAIISNDQRRRLSTGVHRSMGVM